jgi:hypothetical protein
MYVSKRHKYIIGGHGMTNYKEILRLNALEIQKKDIAQACLCSRNTVANVLKRAAEQRLTWEQAKSSSDKKLAEKLFGHNQTRPAYKMPDYQYVHREMGKSGVTLNTQVKTAQYIKKDKKADYVLFVKGNQPTLLKDIQDL